MEKRGTRGRPRGFDKLKYWRVLRVLLNGPHSFGEIVSFSGLSKRFVSKVLKDALMRDLVEVDYQGHRAIYSLVCEDLILPSVQVCESLESKDQKLEKPNYLFEDWWNLGRPQIDEFFELLEDRRTLEYFHKLKLSDFLYCRYPNLKISDPKFWENEDNIPSKLAGEITTFKRLYETVNRDGLKRRKTFLEDLVLTRVVDAMFNGLLCPHCFRRGEASLLEERDGYYLCRNRRCGASFKHPWKNSKIYDEFAEWIKQGDTIRIGRIKITYPPKKAENLLEKIIGNFPRTRKKIFQQRV